MRLPCPREVKSFEELFYETPLYERVKLPDDLVLKALMIGVGGLTFEGYCAECGKEQPFLIRPTLTIRESIKQYAQDKSIQSGVIGARCTRDTSHKLRIFFDIEDMYLIKIGQSPSLADIGNAEIKRFRGVLPKQDLSELHKAIGLGAHGVGVGSFAYLRRIFERLIQSRFDEFQEAEGWDSDKFEVARMDEKVGMIKTHIPEILYEHRKIYAILSKGIHELSENECLEAFPWLKKSIMFILDDDLRKKEELMQRNEVAKELGKFH